MIYVVFVFSAVLCSVIKGWAYHIPCFSVTVTKIG